MKTSHFGFPTLAIPTSTASKGWQTLGDFRRMPTLQFESRHVDLATVWPYCRWHRFWLTLHWILDHAQNPETFTNAHIWLWIDRLYIQISAKWSLQSQSPTSESRLALQNLIVSQLAKRILVLYETLHAIHLGEPPNIVTHLCTGLPRPLPFRFPHQNLVRLYTLSHAC